MSSAGSRHRRNNNRSGTLPVVLAVLAVVAVIAIVVMVTVGGNPTGEDVADRDTDTPRANEVGQSLSVDATGCLDGLESADQVLAAAAPAAQHWSDLVDARRATQRREPVDVAAMQEATSAGPADISQFRDAQESYTNPVAACPVNDPDSGQPLPTECVQRATAANSAVQAATLVVNDFDNDLDIVGQLGSGELNNAQYEARRDRLYSGASAKLTDFNSATNAVEVAPQCPLQPAEATGGDAQ